MLVATMIMILPAVSRTAFLGVPVPVWKFILVWPLRLVLPQKMSHIVTPKRPLPR
jgi:hypothetical protein